MEVKKYLRNKFFLFSVITVDVCFFWGYFLLASLDKIVYPSIAELYNSIFTVYTEFGMLIFPVLILYTFSNDYKNKNILFYKLMGYDFMKYFLEKLIINICSISIPTIFGLLIVGIIYDDFSYLSIMILYFESVICFQILLECLWGFLFKSMMVGYMVNFVYWLFSIIFATATEKLSFFARYDAANNVYLNLGEYFNTHNTNILDIQGNVMFTIFEFVIILSFIWFFRRRWEKNGI